MKRLLWPGLLTLVACSSTPTPADTAERDWQALQSVWTAEAFEHFLAAHPESSHAAEARERAAYQHATDAGSPEALEAFLREHPECRWVDRGHVESLLEHELYRRTIHDTTGAAAEAYLARFPEGDSVESVLGRLVQLRYEQACGARTPEALEAFATRFADHPLADKARELGHEVERELLGLAALAAARTASLVIDYAPPPAAEREQGQPVWLREDLTEPAHVLLRLSGLEEVERQEDADVSIRLRLEAEWIPQSYQGDLRSFQVSNAGLELRSQLELRGGADGLVRRTTSARKEPPASLLFGQRDGEVLAERQVLDDASRFPGLLARADSLEQLATLLVEARGTGLLLAGVVDDSDEVSRCSRSLLKARTPPDAVAPLRELLHGQGLRATRGAVRALDGWWSPGVDADERERLAFQLFQSEDPPAPAGFTQASLPLASLVLLGDDQGLWMAAPRAARVLGTIGAPAVDVLISALDRPGAQLDDERTRAIVAGLTAIGEPAVAPLVAALEHGGLEVREAAAFTLGVMRPPAALVALERAASEDEAGLVRAAAADAVARIHIDPLLERLSSPEAGKRQEAVFQLRGIREPRALAACIRTLHDEVPIVRREAIASLRATGGAEVIEPLLGALADEEGDVRMQAATALGVLGDTQAVEPLIALLDDPERLPRAAAAWALGRLADERAIAPLREHLEDPEESVRERVREALDRLGTPPPPVDG